MKILGAAVLIGLALAAPASAQGESALMAARDLYASARYDEALTVLNDLRGTPQADRRSVEQYRSLCLLALGRASEAESAIGAVVTVDPTYQPAEADASPRVRATFSEVRRRLLPEIATSRYQEAKAAYGREEWASAEEQFRVVLALIDDPDMGGRLADLRVLTSGFLELSAKAATPPPPAPEPAAAAPPVVQAPAPPPGPDPDRIYNVEDEGVTVVAVIRQDIPNVPAGIIALAKPRGVLEVIVDERGRVVGMTIRSSIHPAYDSQLLAAARDWRYAPATVQGQPVKFRKLIQIAVKR